MRVLLVSLVLCASACHLELPSADEPAVRSREALGAPYQLRDIGPSGYSNSSGPFGFTPVPSTTRTAFFATTPTEGTEPWVTDGTAAGTMLLADLLPGLSPSSANYTTTPSLSSRWLPLGNALFTRATERAGVTLWRTDGTPAGTQRVFSGEHISLGPEAIGGQLLFAAQSKLYVSDGTTAGTTSSVTMACTPQSLTGAPSFALVTCRSTSDFVTRPWASDGTPAALAQLAAARARRAEELQRLAAARARRAAARALPAAEQRRLAAAPARQAAELQRLAVELAPRAAARALPAAEQRRLAAEAARLVAVQARLAGELRRRAAAPARPAAAAVRNPRVAAAPASKGCSGSSA